mmetsp:Transcript_26457/g.49449  ORF Transcript_26457/g.49449 Transcript_26457/m.49449 type:complete len:297 (-) Transcript_26457:182-1072(-)
MAEELDEYQKMLIRLRNDKGSNGPQAATVMKQHLTYHAPADDDPIQSEQQKASMALGAEKKSKRDFIIEAKKTNVYVDSRLGDNSYKVTYLGAKGRRLGNIPPPERVVPTNQELNAFYVASHKTPRESSQGLAWAGSGGLQRIPKPKRQTSPKGDEAILEWREEGMDEEKYKTTTDEYPHHKEFESRVPLEFAKCTKVLLGAAKPEKKSLSQDSYLNHGKVDPAKKSESAKGSHVFMTWDPDYSHKTTGMSYGKGFRQQRNGLTNAKPRIQKYRGIPPHMLAKKSSPKNLYRGPLN